MRTMQQTGQEPSAKQIALIERLRMERGIEADWMPKTKRAASTVIEELFATPRPSGPKAEPGYYVKGEQVYIVVTNKAGTSTYAKELIVEGGRGRWSYAPGVGRNLATDGLEPLSVEEAARLGRQYGVCVICGRTLTDPESVQAGIGPVCSAKLR